MTTQRSPLQPFLDRRGVVVLDGGLASELEARGHDLSSSLWSARLLRDDPEAIIEVHRAFLRAGADVLTSCSYQASFEGFARHGVTAETTEQLLRLSLDLARRAVAAEGLCGGELSPLVAASVGPYGAYLADGSEYRGRYGVTDHHLAAFHRRRLHVLADGGADLLACETIPSAREAHVLTTLLEARRRQGRGVGAWLSLQCRDAAHLADGTPLRRVVEALAPSPSWLALGINCTAPRFVAPLLDIVRSVTDKPAVAYPNSGEIWHAETKRWLSTTRPETPRMAAQAVSWWRHGGRLIGGCCRTTPGQVRAMGEAVLAVSRDDAASPPNGARQSSS